MWMEFPGVAAMDCLNGASSEALGLIQYRGTTYFQFRPKQIGIRKSHLSHPKLRVNAVYRETNNPKVSWRIWSCENFIFSGKPGSDVFKTTETFEHTSNRKGSEGYSGMELNNLSQVLQCFGRTLLVIILGIGFARPALSQAAVPSTEAVSSTINEKYSNVGRVSTTSRKGKNLKSSKMNLDEKNCKTDSTTKTISDCTGLSSVLETPNIAANSDSPQAEFDEMEHIRLSEAFWKGIPAPEGSRMYDLKLQLYRYPNDTRALEVLLHVVMDRKDMLRALTIVETLVELQPTRLKWRLLKARIHEFIGELSMAKKEYQELLKVQPLSARFLQGFIMLLNKIGEGREALELLKSTLQKAITDNKNVEARDLGILLSQFYIQLGKFDEAQQQLESLVLEDPTDFRPYLCQGLLYSLMDKKDEAEENFKKYQELCPPDSLDESFLDNRLLQAKIDHRNNILMKKALKSSFKKKGKKAKVMQQPPMSVDDDNQNTVPDSS